MAVAVNNTSAWQMFDILEESDYGGLKSAFKQKDCMAWGFTYSFLWGMTVLAVLSSFLAGQSRRSNPVELSNGTPTF